MIYQKKVYNMEQSKYYVTHYFNAQNAGGFLIVSLIGLIIVLAIVLIIQMRHEHPIHLCSENSDVWLQPDNSV